MKNCLTQSLMRKSSVLLIALTFSLFTYAQTQPKWVEMMEDPNVNYYELKAEGDKYFSTHYKGKGSGYKQYQRFLYQLKFEVDENGDRIFPDQYYREIVSYEERHTQARTSPVAKASNWSELGPDEWNATTGWNPGVGRITSIARHPSNANIIYIGSPGGGCWRSNNGGNTWTVLTDNEFTMEVFSIAIDPASPSTVYIGTVAGGILKSTNSGSSWTQLSTGMTSGTTVNKILINPTNTNTVIAASTNGIYRSTDAGVNWTRVYSTGGFYDMEFKPGDPSILYASNTAFHRSTDGGVTWTNVTSGIPNSGRTLIGVSPADADYVYLVQSDGNVFGWLYRSTDSGLNFTTRIDGDSLSGTNYFGYSSDGRDTGGQAWYDMAICVNPTDIDDLIIGGIICWRSTNGGTSFNAITEWFFPNSTGYNHADIHALEWIDNTIYSGSDGGIFRSTDNGDNWTDLSVGLGIRQFYRLGAAPTSGYVIAGGAQDNGGSIMDGTNNWYDWLGADQMETFFDISNPDIVYAASYDGYVAKSIDRGITTTSITKPSTLKANWVAPWVPDPTDANTSYFGSEEIYKTTDGGSTWSTISSFSAGNLDNIAVAPSDNDYIYASIGSSIYRTTDGGANWTNISSGSGGGMITYIAVHPTKPAVIAISTTAANKVYKSTDAGATWTSLRGTLPNVPSNTLVFDDHNNEPIYLGMKPGIFYIDNTMTDWIPFMENLPKVQISELEIHYGTRRLRAATYGRGIWESEMYDPNNKLPKVKIVTPLNAEVFEENTNVNITAEATDTDGAIVKVEFYEGITKLSEDNSFPYTAVLNNVAIGTYTLTAWAYDNGGGLAKSTAVTIIVKVKDNCLNIPNYAEGNSYGPGSVVRSGANFYECKPWPFSGWCSLASWAYGPGIGSHWQDAWIDRGACYQSNQKPTVSLTSPLDGTDYGFESIIPLQAIASDADGIVARVDFFAGSNLITLDNTSPYSYDWTNTPVGNYELTAVATDNYGMKTTSNAVDITVSLSTVCNSLPQYVDGTSYGPGNQVKNLGSWYECKPWPFSGWCSLAGVAYGPGTGTNWQDAWILKGSCSAKFVTVADNQSANSLNIVLMPNPTASDFTVTFTDATSSTATVEVYNNNGQKILIQENVHSGDFVSLANATAGMFTVKVILPTGQSIYRIIKQ